MPVFVTMMLLIGGALIMTNFLSNTVTMFLFYSIAISLLSNSNINMTAFIILIGLASCIGILTPSAAVPAPLFFGPNHITVKNIYKYSLLYILLTFIGCMFIIWPIAKILI